MTSAVAIFFSWSSPNLSGATETSPFFLISAQGLGARG